MKVVFTPQAKGDLIEIARHISGRNPRRAKTFVGELRAKAMALGDRPLAFPLVDGFARQGLGRRVLGDYLIVYRVEDRLVAILRILHGARDYETLLAPAKPRGRKDDEPKQ